MPSTVTSEELHARIVGQNIPKRFLANLERNGDIEVLNWQTADGGWESLTLSQVADHTARLVAALKDLGVSPGDKVVMMMRNRQEFHALDLAVLFCGATPVSIYNSSAPDQIQYLVNDSGASVAILEDSGFLERFESVRDKIPTIQHIALIETNDETGDDIVRYSDMVAFEPADLAAEAETATLSDLATIIYTSGTTGPPKGVMLSHSNVVWTLESVGQSMRDQTDIDDFAGKSHLSYLPMAHVMERLLGHYYMLDFGTKVYCCPETSQMPAMLRESRPSLFIGVPRVWEKLYAGVNAALSADPDKERQFNEAVAAGSPIMAKMTRGEATDEEIATWNFLDGVGFKPVRELIGLDRVEIGISGAAPIPAEILDWFRTIGVPLSEGYGMSETVAVLSWSSAAKPGFVGQAATGVEITIADDGEVLARGGNIFEGYLGLPDKTAETIDEDGWLHTGDIGVLDDEGYLKIVDRKKELIITAGGKNISPANLEAALKMIPLIGQACAVGEQKPFVAALVVLDPDASAAWAAEHGLTGDAATMTEMAKNPDVIAEIEAGLADAMADFNNAESVKKVKVLGEEWLPDSELLTPTSKLKRRGILATFADEIEALYVR
ncbi:AMP-dependent synthetase/ligase [Ilumatobacter coccineus]|uniref:Acyl-CoA synthetase n=1 Tax=Ilumatobacter coccineus (strain NBRC 103263 / KCTC 29153 / YM16-304) TaxID=1313172 RepID=A0A6C7EDM9_ILUCY|nr:AMP-dependent synthetase/ligase [Ilumatobacter coccineus]BAN02728.1 putative long-chain-fatty-acid--CoA ligase [Ilumatobacter coccineus YM16-304]